MKQSNNSQVYVCMYVCVFTHPMVIQGLIYSRKYWNTVLECESLTLKKKKEGKVLHFNRGRQKITIKIVNIECGVC